MKTFQWVIVGILIPIVAIFLTYFLNKKSPDVRYTLSEGIPITSFQTEPAQNGDSKISVQELVLKNLGNSKSENIQIKIGCNVIKHELIKNFDSDEPKVIKNNDSFSLKYPELPPKGSFKLIFSTNGMGVPAVLISILDQNGLCKQAFTQNKFSLSVIFSAIILTGLYFALILFSIASLLMDQWKFRLKIKTYHEIIAKKKPFYASDESWNNAVTEALESKIANDYYSEDIQESLCYKVLCSAKPPLVADHVWIAVLKNASSDLEKQFTNRMDYLYGEHIIKLLQIKKPDNFVQNKWDNIRKLLNTRYISYLKSESRFYDAKHVIVEIRKDKPAGIETKYWEEYLEYLKRVYRNFVAGEMFSSENPLSYLEEVDLDHILENGRDKIALKDKAYKIMVQSVIKYLDYQAAVHIIESQKPEWMKVEDFDKIKKDADRVIKHHKFEHLYELLNIIFINQLLPLEMPSCLSDREWSIMLDIEQRLKKSRNKDT